MTPQEKLRKAASLVSEVCKGLEVESRACRCCERVTFPNWPAKVVSDKLATVASRLLDAANVDPQAWMTIKELADRDASIIAYEKAIGFRSAH